MGGMDFLIHASAREATDHGQAVRVQRSVSIHASAREATETNIQHGKPGWSFNPRLREGGDYNTIAKTVKTNISIHASAREATRTMDVKISIISEFQSTPPRGRRLQKR